MGLIYRPFHGPSSSGPWAQGADQSGPSLHISGLTNGVQRYGYAVAVDQATGLVSAPSNIVSCVPNSVGGGGNPSPDVTWAEPT
ncbi:MAG: hypothetical protein R3F17_14230, partial [Planctomycetota bacterium]